MAKSREFELKFAIAAGESSTLATHPLLAKAKRRAVVRLDATYFDTPDRRLWKQGISLRVRDRQGRKTQTLKHVGASAIDRGEWEAETDAAVPSLDWLATTPLRRAFRHQVGDTLGPSFKVEVERRTFLIEKGSCAIEAAIDRGEIQAGGRCLSIHEFELELKRGEPAGLFEIGRRFVADVSLTPSLISKAERGHRLLDGSWGLSSKAPVAALDSEMPSSQAFQAIAEACLHEMMLNVEAFAIADSIEAVHRSRVALRRLRAAFSLFSPLLRDDVFKGVRDDFKWMSDLLGSARDLDVLQSEVFDPAATGVAIPGGDELARHMRAKRQEAHASLAEGLVSQRWRIALITLIAWLSDGAWLREEHVAITLKAFMGKRLRKRYQQLLSMGADLERLTPEERHKVRIQAKKLRYSLGFVEATPTLVDCPKAFRAAQAGLETLQTTLGKLHDQEAKQDLLRAEASMGDDFDGHAGDRAIFAAGVLTISTPDRDALLPQAVKAYRKVKKHNPF